MTDYRVWTVGLTAEARLRFPLGWCGRSLNLYIANNPCNSVQYVKKVYYFFSLNNIINIQLSQSSINKWSTKISSYHYLIKVLSSI